MEFLISIYILKTITSLEFVILYQVYYVVIIFFVILFLKEFGEFKKINTNIIKYRSSAYVF